MYFFISILLSWCYAHPCVASLDLQSQQLEGKTINLRPLQLFTGRILMWMLLMASSSLQYPLGVVFLIYLLTRLHYSHSQFVCGFVLLLNSFFMVSFMHVRCYFLDFFVIPVLCSSHVSISLTVCDLVTAGGVPAAKHVPHLLSACASAPLCSALSVHLPRPLLSWCTCVSLHCITVLVVNISFYIK